MNACTFCDKPKETVKWLIAAPGNKALICDECVDLSKEIIDDERVRARVKKEILEDMARKEAAHPSSSGVIKMNNSKEESANVEGTPS